jgi:alpha-tubulin suppressor-like RCC1 family protein
MRSVMETWMRAVLVGSAFGALAACGGGEDENSNPTDDGGGLGSDTGNGDAGFDAGVDPDGGSDAGPDGGSPDPDGGPGDPDGDEIDVDGPDGTPGPLDTFFEGELSEIYGASTSFAFGCTRPPCTFQCSVTGREEEECTSPWTPVGLAEQRYTLAVTAVAADGLRDDTPATHAFQVDTTEPETTAGAEIPAWLRPGAAEPLRVTCTDASATRLECSTVDGVWEPCTSPINLPGSEGTIVFRARCVDAAGNADLSSFFAVYTWDGTPPAVFVIEEPPARTTNAQPNEFDLGCDDTSPCTWACTLDDEPLTDCTFPLVLPELAPGVHRFTAQPTDAAGNQAITLYQWEWTIETGWANLDLDDGTTCGVTTDGGVYCWGYLLNLVAGSTFDADPTAMNRTDATQVSLGREADFLCAVTRTGEAVCRGANSVGQLGRGATSDRNDAWAPVQDLSGVTAVETGRAHACAIVGTGEVWCWGSNEQGEAAPGVESAAATRPVRIALPSPATQLAVGAQHSCALLSTDEVWCWGDNSDDQLGRPEAGSGAPPARISGDSAWTDLAAGDWHTCATNAASQLWCWGSNRDNQLGLGPDSAPSASTPLQVVTASVDAFALAGDSTCLVQSAQLFCAGDVSVLGTPGLDESPEFVAGVGTNVRNLSLGRGMICGFEANGVAQCWGPEWYTSIRSLRYDHTPTRLDDGWATLSVSRGDLPIGCGIKEADRSLWCWGSSRGGASFGRNIGWSEPVPSTVYSGLVWRDIAVGSDAICGVPDFGGLLCWGNNSTGQVASAGRGGDVPALTSPPGPQNWVDVEAGAQAMCGRRTDGTLWCWGNNYFGEIGTGSSAAAPDPVQVGTATDWLAISMGNARSCGLRGASLNNATLWCWGLMGFSNDLSPVQVGTAGAWRDIEASALEDFAITGSGQLQAAGRLDAPGAPRPPLFDLFSESRWTAIDGAYTRRCAVTEAGAVRCWGSQGVTGLLGLAFGAEAESPVAPPLPEDVTFTEVRVGGNWACALDDTGGRWCWGDRVDQQLGDGFLPAEPAEFAPPEP